jgi:hypothetical protein
MDAALHLCSGLFGCIQGMRKSCYQVYEIRGKKYEVRS